MQYLSYLVRLGATGFVPVDPRTAHLATSSAVLMHEIDRRTLPTRLQVLPFSHINSFERNISRLWRIWASRWWRPPPPTTEECDEVISAQHGGHGQVTTLVDPETMVFLCASHCCLSTTDHIFPITSDPVCSRHVWVRSQSIIMLEYDNY